jgi:cyanamide hydratase
LIQLATLYDNVGKYEGIDDFASLVHKDTLNEVNKAFPRLRWCDSFAATIRREEGCKPWCHSTHIPNFDKNIESNSLHKQWE